MKGKKILIFNPRATDYKPRIPNSVLQVAASIDGLFDYVIVDGNLENDPQQKILNHFASGEFGYFALSVMPGPQLKQAIPISKKVKEKFPETVIIWGGYFASNQSSVVLNSDCVDYIVYGPGDKTFPQLLHHLQNQLPVETCHNLIFKSGGTIRKTQKDELYDQDELPPLPYEKLNSFLSPSEIPRQNLFGSPHYCLPFKYRLPVQMCFLWYCADLQCTMEREIG
jgi:radical SAM superfamily enzyme YgiQ (UPF0313 family)